MNLRHLTLLGSLFISGLLTLRACGSSSSAGTGGTGALGGTTGAQGGTTGSHGGTTGSQGGTTGSQGGHPGSAGGAPATGSCSNLPSCVQPLVNCEGSGTC